MQQERPMVDLDLLRQDKLCETGRTIICLSWRTWAPDVAYIFHVVGGM